MGSGDYAVMKRSRRVGVFVCILVILLCYSGVTASAAGNSTTTSTTTANTVQTGRALDAEPTRLPTLSTLSSPVTPAPSGAGTTTTTAAQSTTSTTTTVATTTSTTTAATTNMSDEDKSWWENILIPLTTITGVLADPSSLLDAGLNFLLQKLVAVFDELIPTINNGVQSIFFQNNFIVMFLALFKWLAMILLTVGFIARLMRMLDATRHGESADFRDCLTDILKAYGLTLFCLPIMNFLNQLFAVVSNQVVALIPQNPSFSITAALLGRANVTGNLLLVIVVLVIVLIMFFRVMKRVCVIFLQIVLGYLYAYDIAKGDNMIGEWAKDVLAGYLSYFFQMMFFRIGIALFSAGLSAGSSPYSGDCLVGLALLIGVTAVPSALKKFGQSSSSGVGRSFGQVVMMGASMARFII